MDISYASRSGAGPVLAAEAVVKRFGLHTVLNNVDLALGPGQSTCIIGPSGSGKTTLLPMHGLAGAAVRWAHRDGRDNGIAGQAVAGCARRCPEGAS